MFNEFLTKPTSIITRPYHNSNDAASMFATYWLHVYLFSLNFSAR
ncbi:hypothetical protein FHS10_005165, partial [Mucilaginibacter dorajii]|nr:hypothetical protein [Mucilaginibacter dorajii]